MKIKYALCGMLAMLPVICCAQAMTEQQKNFHEKVISPIKREISPLVHLCWFENLESSSVCVNGTSGMGYEIPHYIKNNYMDSIKFTANVVVGHFGNESPDSNRFTLVTPKPENGVRLQATLQSGPTDKPVGAVRKKV